MRLKISKKSLLLFLALIIIGLFVFFVWFFQKEVVEEREKEVPEEFREDETRPISKIVSPDAGSFQRENFSVEVFDIDIGISGLDGEHCRYSIYNCKEKPCRLTLLDAKRNCQETAPPITVGENGNCPSQGINVCRVIVESKDRAGNSNIFSETEGSVKDFSIDWTPPKAEMADLPVVQKGATQTISALVSDNVALADCKFFIRPLKGNWEEIASLNFENIPCPQNHTGKCYRASKEYAFNISEDHNIYAQCWDRAGNVGYSQTKEIKIFVNQPPEISFCRVVPAQGNLLTTEFKFQVEAFDPDGDELFYQWNFGDGEVFQEKNPGHYYSSVGVFEPQVVVSDGELEAECSTAWVVVGEE